MMAMLRLQSLPFLIVGLILFVQDAGVCADDVCIQYRNSTFLSPTTWNGEPTDTCYWYYHYVGWYRLNGTIATQCPAAKGATCSTNRYNGYLTYSNPAISDGNVSRTLCLTYRGSCNCAYSYTVIVRNCGDFLVYQFPYSYHLTYCNAVLCGAHDNMLNPHGPCFNYKNSSLLSPLTWNDKPTDTCYWYYHYVGWYRFNGTITTQCPAATRATCSTNRYNSYLTYANPAVSDGNVTRTLCLTSGGSCGCSYSHTVRARNCGDFMVYQLPYSYQLTYCNAVLCGARDNTIDEHGPCFNYVNSTFLFPVTRYGRTTYTCNWYYHSNGWYRFNGTIATQCPAETNQTCSTNRYNSYLTYKNPKSSDGYVTRTLCMASPGSCACAYTFNVTVRNCGKFFIYGFPYSYPLQYCNGVLCGVNEKQCSAVTDIGFVLDSSGSMGSDYVKAKTFIKLIAEAYGLSLDGSHAGVVLFSSSAYPQIIFSQGNSLGGFRAAVDRLPFLNSGTRIDLGIQVAKDQLFQQSRGMRQNSRKLLILITDGYHSGSISYIQSMVKQMQSAGIRTLVIGLGGSINKIQLDNIALTSKYVHIANSADFLTSVKFISSFTDHACMATENVTAFIESTPSITSTFILSSSVAPTPPTNDGCYNYKTLYGSYRQVDTNMEYYACDDKLYGWYRYQGSGGTMMANFCPTPNNMTRCGGTYMGWLHGSHPGPHDGIVPRTVCFSDQFSCSCQMSTTIYVKDCGGYYVYWLNSVPKCSARYCGMYDTVNVTCKEHEMRIDVSRRYFMDRTYVATLRDFSCVANITQQGGFVSTKLNACGTSRTDYMKTIKYENEVIIRGISSNGLVTYSEQIVFSCTYHRSGQISSVSYRPVSRVRSYEDGFGNFTFNFRIYQSPSYLLSFLPWNFPVKVDYAQWLFLEASVTTGDKDIIIHLNRCFSTPSPYRDDPKFVNLILNRCPTDSSTEFVTSPSNHLRRFKTRAVKFLGGFTTTYIHCDVFLCLHNSTDSRCHSSCQKTGTIRKRRDVDDVQHSRERRNIEQKEDTSKVYLLSQGPVISNPQQKATPKSDASSDNIMPIALGAVVGVLVVAVAGLIVKMRMANKQAKVTPTPSYPMQETIKT